MAALSPLALGALYTLCPRCLNLLCLHGGRKDFCDFGRPVPGSQPGDLLGGQCPFSGPLHSHDIKFSDESWGQEAPMTLGLSKTHGIFFWKGHFNKAVCLWVTPRFLWGDRGLISMLDK